MGEDTRHMSAGVAGRVAFGLLAAVAVAVPLVVAATPGATPLMLHETSAPKLVVLWLLTVSSAAAWALSVSRDGRIRWVRAFAAALGFAVAAIASWVASVDRDAAFLGTLGRHEGLAALLAYVLLGWLALQLVDSVGRMRTLSTGAWAAGAVVAAYGIAQEMGIDPLRWGGRAFEESRAFGTLGNPDNLGSYLVLCLPLAVVAAVTTDRRATRVGATVGSMLMAAVAVLSYSRAAWLGMAVAMCGLVWATVRAGEREKRAARYALAAVAAAVALAVAASVVGATTLSVTERAASVLTQGGSGAARVSIWKAALGQAADRPLVGTGPDTFVYGWYRHRPADDAVAYGMSNTADEGHSYPLHVSATLGLPAVLFLFVFIAAATMAGARHVGLGRIESAGWWAGVVGYLACLAVGTSSLAGTSLLWIALGVLMSPSARVVVVDRRLRWAPIVGALGLMVATAVPFARFVDADVKAAAVLESNDPLERALRADAAAETLSGHAIYALEAAEMHVSAAQSFVQSGDDAAAASQLGIARARLESLVAQLPSNYQARVALARVLLLEGLRGDQRALREAAFTAERASGDFPAWPLPRLLRARALFELGDQASARDVIEGLELEFPGVTRTDEARSVLGEAGAL